MRAAVAGMLARSRSLEGGGRESCGHASRALVTNLIAIQDEDAESGAAPQCCREMRSAQVQNPVVAEV